MTTLARIALLSVCASGIFAGTAHAQSAEQRVEGYVPPPMFGAPPAVQQRPAGPIVTPNRSPAVDSTPIQRQEPSPLQGGQPTYVKPRVSRDNIDGPVSVEPYIPKFPPMAPVPMEQTPAGRGEIVERPRAPLAAPQPGKKPPAPAAPSMAASPSAAPIETPVAATPQQPAAPAPIAPTAPVATAPVPVTQAAPAPVPVETPVAAPPPAPAVPDNAQPAQKVTSKGVVTGPKTMPSVGVGGVEKLETFTPGEAAEKTMLEQHAERQHAETTTAAAPASAPTLPPLPPGFMPLAQIEAIDASRSRMRLIFAPGQADLNTGQRLTVLHNLVPILSGDGGQNLMIQSYATPADKGQSSDRRIALSRALAIRETLLDHGIEARRIDVRALGAQTDQGAVDRADLVLTAQ